MADLYEKTNTDFKVGIKLLTEETKWFRDYPRENIKVSGNENRIPVLLTQPNAPSMIGDGGNERIMITNAPTHGTFMPVQMNVRYGYTGLAQALDARSRAAQIEAQTAFQAQQATYSVSRGIGLSTYGASSGTLAVVKTTGSGGTTQNGIALKNAFGSSTFVAGGDVGLQDTYLSQIFRVNDRIALIRGASIVEFANVTASPSAGSGVGFIDALFTSSITPTVGDLIVFAMADGDNTITGTDVNNWAYGFTEALTAASFEGISGGSGGTYPLWSAGSTANAPQRFGYAVKEKMINDCWNVAGVRLNRFIIGQGVRRDTIGGELGGRRYDSSDVDIEGDLKPGKGQQNFTSQLALPGTVIGFYDQAVSKIELSDLPEEGGGKSIFKIDKVQGKSQLAAYFDYFYQRIFSSRGALAYATNLTSA